MNIKDQTNQIIYFNNLKLAEIRGNIEDQIKRVDNELFSLPQIDMELIELREQLEEIYNKLG